MQVMSHRGTGVDKRVNPPSRTLWQRPISDNDPLISINSLEISINLRNMSTDARKPQANS